MNRRLTLLLLAAVALAGAVRAQIVPDLKLPGTSSESPMMWARATLRNNTGDPAVCSLVFQDTYGSEERLDGQKVESGETRVIDVALPFHEGAQLTVTDDQGRVSSAYASSRGGGGVANFLVIADLQNFASESAMQSFTTAAMTTLGVGGGGSSGANNVTQIEPEKLPNDWRCYIPFRQVFVQDYIWRRMNPDARQALTDWVRLGGLLGVYGGDVDKAEKDLLGTIVYTRVSPVESTTVRREIAIQPPWQSFLANGNLKLNTFPYHTREAGGRTGGLALATIFCILAGPVNLWYCRRKRRVRMVLLTVPLLSLSFCLLMTGYFVLSQGFQKRGGSVSLTVLDENSSEAFTFGFHSLISGLYPYGGFQFAPRAAFLAGRAPYNSKDSAQMDLTNGTKLTGGLFKPTIAFDYQTILPRPTRERMIINFDDKTATNGFESPVRALAVIRGGRVWTGGEAAPGAKAPIKMSMTSSGSQGVALVNALLPSLTDPDLADFVRSTALNCAPQLDDEGRTYYLALLDKAPEAASAGLVINHGNACHLLLGIAGAPAEAEARP